MGILADRVDLSLEKLQRDRDGLCAYAGWRADKLGRWIGAAAVLAEITGRDLQNQIQTKEQALLDAQELRGNV